MPRSRPIRSDNLVARRTGEGPLLALVAHVDLIGLAVSHIADDGLLAVHRLGGSRASVAYGQRVAIRTQSGPVHGVVARTVEGRREGRVGELYVDIGARDGEEARALVEPGDPMVVVAPPLELAGGRVASRASTTAPPSTSRSRRCAGSSGATVGRARRDGAGGGRRRRRAGAAAPALGRTSRSRSTSPTRPTSRRRQPEAGGHPLGGGPAIFRGPAVMHPRPRAAPGRAPRRRGSTTRSRSERRRSPTPTSPSPPRAGIPTGLVSVPIRQHALADRDRPALRSRGVIRLLVAFAAEARARRLTYAR